MAKGYKTGGRQAGSLNRVTTQFKQAVAIVYENLGGHEAFTEWASTNKSDFYTRIAARLIPSENSTNEGNGVTIVINRNGYELEQNEVLPIPYEECK